VDLIQRGNGQQAAPVSLLAPECRLEQAAQQVGRLPGVALARGQDHDLAPLVVGGIADDLADVVGRDEAPWPPGTPGMSGARSRVPRRRLAQQAAAQQQVLVQVLLSGTAR